MSDRTFWLGVWGIFVPGILIFLWLLFHYESVDFRQRNDALVKMVAAGADPIAARCALRGEMGPNCGFYNLARVRSR